MLQFFTVLLISYQLFNPFIVFLDTLKYFKLAIKRKTRQQNFCSIDINCVSKLMYTSLYKCKFNCLFFAFLCTQQVYLEINLECIESKSSCDNTFIPLVAQLPCDWLSSTENQERGGKIIMNFYKKNKLIYLSLYHMA